MSTRQKFEDLLKEFVKATNASKDLAQQCANMAIIHFKDHDDTVYCQKFMDAMPQNYLRKAAFVAWLVKFSPIELVESKFKKDKDRAKKEGDKAWDIETALEISFWEFKPERPITNFSADDLRVQVLRLVKRFRSDKYKAEDSDAIAFVNQLENFAENAKPMVETDEADEGEATLAA